MALPRGPMAADVRERTRVGTLGSPVAYDYNSRPYVNESPAAAQVSTITVNTATASTLYTVTINGSVTSYTAAASGDTTTTIALALANAIKDNPAASAYVTVAPVAAVITATARLKGVAVTITASSLSTVATTTAATASEEVGFGRGVLLAGYVSDEADSLAANAKATLLTAQVITCDYTYDATSTLVITITDKHSGKVIANTSVVNATGKLSTTAALVVLINGQLPASSVLAATGASDVLTLTAEVAGFEFDVSFGGDAAALATSVAYTTGPSVSTSVLRAFAGVTMFSSAIAASAITDLSASYPGSGVMAVMNEGAIWVASAETIVQGSTVYIDVGATNFGKFYQADSAATRLELPLSMARWSRSTHSDSGDYAALYINANK